jgi:hypothetical protein
MSSNYQGITDDNIRRRGEDFDEFGEFVAEQLYSDRTHFIYEILQNAEDALSRRVQNQPDNILPKSVAFRLYSHRLEVSHFGQPFTEDDVRAISDVLRGTKKADEKQIGKFGIGFKSVYAFTSTPEIHSGEEHFLIERYIRPHVVEPRELLEGETLFIFPFNHQLESAEKIFRLISDRLRSLQPRTIIFLRYIDEISWSIEDKAGKGTSGNYRREYEQIDSSCRKVLVDGQILENWLIFDKSIPTNTNLKVEIAFLLGQDKVTGKEQIISVKNGSPLFVFFPTEFETELNFLVQGQYKTTPARDNILRGDDYNKELIKLTATLVAEVLPKIRNMGLLTVNFLNVLPIRKSDFEKNSLFLPIFERVRQTFQDKSLLPTNKENEYISAENAKLARSKDLRQLLTEKQLRQLYGKTYQWLSDEITLGKTSDIYTYIKDELTVQLVEPEDFVRQLNKAFIEEQHDTWLAYFYAFLNGQSALWRSDGLLRNKAFIRLQDNTHVMPFNKEGLPNAHIPFLLSGEKTEFPTVKREILLNQSFGKDATRFLQSLGLSQPDIFDEVMSKTIPKYEKGVVDIKDVTQHDQDIQKIIQAIRQISILSANRDKKERLISKLRETPFLRTINALTGRQDFKKPGDKPREIIYFRSSDLEVYFRENPNICFLDETSTEQEQLAILGVSHKVKVFCRKSESDGNIIISSSHSNHQRGLEGFDPGCEIDGLEFALKNPTPGKSLYIWNNLLRDNLQHISGEVQQATNKSFTNAQPRIKMTSKMGAIVCNKSWLPDKNNNFHKPNELSLDDLSDDFIKSSALASRLGVKQAKSSQEIAEQIYKLLKKRVKPEILDYIMRNLEKIEQFIKEDESRKLKKTNSSDSTTEYDNKKIIDELDYITAFKEAFNRPGETDLLGYETPLSPIPNPKDRENKIKNDIKVAKEQEPLRAERFQKVPTNRWESKNTEEVRGFLVNTYGGKCQICDVTFPKRDGAAYFEGLYIVASTNARWIDRPGNVLCSCANCCAKLMHGSVQVEGDILEQIATFRAYNDGGSTEHKVRIKLCGKTEEIKFNERHIIEIQQLLGVASEDE